MRNPQVHSRRGLVVLGGLVVSVVVAGGIGLASISGGSAPTRANFSARLIDAKEALVDGKFETAEVFTREVLSRSPDSIEARLLLSRILRAAGKLTASRQILDKIHKENPEQTEVLVGLGEIHEKRGEFDLAIACYKRAAELQKDNASTWKALGMAQIRKGDNMAALFSLRQSQKIRAGQEDVAKLMDEIGMSRAVMATTPGRRGDSRSDPFGDLAPRPGLPDGRLFDPSRPSPLVPDPLEAVRNPGGVRR